MPVPKHAKPSGTLRAPKTPPPAPPAPKMLKGNNLRKAIKAALKAPDLAKAVVEVIAQCDGYHAPTAHAAQQLGKAVHLLGSATHGVRDTREAAAAKARQIIEHAAH